MGIWVEGRTEEANADQASGGPTAESRPRKQLWLPPPQQSHSGSYIRRTWRLTTRWSFQPLTEPKELIEHYADSQQHQQRHDDGGRHSFIIPSPHRHRFTASDAGYNPCRVVENQGCVLCPAQAVAAATRALSSQRPNRPSLPRSCAGLVRDVSCRAIHRSTSRITERLGDR